MTQEEKDSACPELVVVPHEDNALARLLGALSLGGGEGHPLDGGSVKDFNCPSWTRTNLLCLLAQVWLLLAPFTPFPEELRQALLGGSATDCSLHVAVPQLIILSTTCACLAQLWLLQVVQVQLCLPMLLVWKLTKAKGLEARRVEHFDGDPLVCLQEAGQDELIGAVIKCAHSWDEFKKEDPEKIDAIVDVRKKVLSTYSVVEDRLTAVNILVNHWHNRRKTNQKECKDQSLEGLTPDEDSDVQTGEDANPT